MTESIRPTVAFFVMHGDGHFRRLRPLIAGVARRGFTAYVFTQQRFAAAVERAGGTFVDLFATHTVEDADDESVPLAMRAVTFTGRYADEIVREVAARAPSLVIADTFAVIGRVVATALGLPWVNVCAGHDIDPAEALPRLATDVRVRVSPRCERAVETLRDRYGILDASPFSYASTRSPLLNVYCEPAEYLSERGRRALEPVAFFGSLPPSDELDQPAARAGESVFGDARTPLRVYVSFGTIVWRYFASEALVALRTIAQALAEIPQTRALISLGHYEAGADAVRALAHPNVAVRDYVDQWSVLQQANAFITHNGLSSTHEAIFHGVPMVSYPFFWDQPALARKCEELGLATRLVEAERTPLRPADLTAGLDRLRARQVSIRARLAEARDWELRTVAARDAVVDRIVALLD